MSEPSPNDQQRELIESIEGIHLVDAGAGTGKTFTLTRRYANILETTDAAPSDILLMTFTNNAAAEMKERVINHCDYDALDLQEAPISTFHSLCHRILLRDGFEAPELLGFDDRLTSTTRLVENQVLEREEFGEFMRGFVDRHDEYSPFYRVIRDRSNLLGLIQSLAAKGIFPTREGWYQRGEEYLDGDYERFQSLFEEANRTKPGKRGPKQSDLLGRMKGAYRRKNYMQDAPERINLAGGEADKQLRPELARRAFEEERNWLKNFVHDVYREYVEYSLAHNYLSFSSLMMFAYVLLCEREDVRERHRHRYVMVDEFQDTSEIQFKLAMLLSATDNFCVVGDWKQSIYSFQYASVRNIQDFRGRLRRYREELNTGGERITYPVEPVREIDLNVNYRSTQPILDFSERSLVQEATRREEIDNQAVRDRVVSLDAAKTNDATRVEGLESPDEPAAILELIQEITGSDEYRIPDGDGTRTLEFGDVAVLSRTRQFGLELQRKADPYGIPVAYEGGVELFKTNPAIVLLAWLRVLDDPLSVKGWSVILERAGYTLSEMQQYLPEVDEEDEDRGDVASVEDLPEELREFRATLLESSSVTETVKRVFEEYDVRGGIADKLLEVLRRTFEDRYVGRGDLVKFMEDNIEGNQTYSVDNDLEADAVTVQTIHGAKGLEYPVVILADMNRDRFPGVSRGAPVIDYVEPVGLRQRKLFWNGPDESTPFNYDNWRFDLLSKCLTGEYDEERRLLYVALTRAEQYLFLSADEDRAGAFFRGMAEEISVRTVEDPAPRVVGHEPAERRTLEVEEVTDRAPGTLSVHDLMDEEIYEEAEATRGKELGRSVHTFAERFLKDRSPVLEEPGVADKRTLKEYLAGLEGTLRTEVPCSLPLTVGDRRLTVRGVIDLIHETDDRVEVIDYKTDLEPVAEREYRKQLSVYYHAVKGYYDDDRDVVAKLFYTHDGRDVTLDPLEENQLMEHASRAYSS